MPTYDFEDGLIPSDFKNADTNAWTNTTDDSNGGTHSMKANGSALELSSIYIIFELDSGGDFDCDYRIVSEASNDLGYIVVDGVAVVDGVSGAGSWTAMTTQTLSAGVHVIQFQYIKDGNVDTSDDTFYIDNIVLPTADFTIKDDTEFFSGGAIPASGWTNDSTELWESSGAEPTPFTGLGSEDGLGDSETSTLIYDSPSDSPAGDWFFLGRADSEENFDFFKVYVDSVEIYSDSGQFSNKRASVGFLASITSGTHEYKFEYSKDGSALRASDRAYLYGFFEPSMAAAPPAGDYPLAILTSRRRQNRFPNLAM